MTRRCLPVCVLFFILVLSVGCGAGRTYQVTNLTQLQDLVANRANPGDVILIESGVYYLDSAKIPVMRSGTPDRPIVIRGLEKDGKLPVIDASNVNVQRGIFYVEQPVHDVIIENLELCNAAGVGRPGKEFSANAAGVYILGSNITIRRCIIHHCENGLFSTHESDFVLVDNCDIGYNGRKPGIGEPHRTHGFYFNSKHQMVLNSYIHHSTDSENFKSRGGNNIFAFNWVEEECAYSLGVDSGNDQNTLWLGNIVIKRTYDGISQGRLLGVGDGTGVARGTLVALNNTFVTTFPRDFYLFTEKSSTTDVILMNNVFAGPGQLFLEKDGQGTITGRNNWIANAAGAVPETIEDTIRGDDPGFFDVTARQYHPKADSPLVDAGITGEEFSKAIQIVTQYSREGIGAKPSPKWLSALEVLEGPSCYRWSTRQEVEKYAKRGRRVATVRSAAPASLPGTPGLQPTSRGAGVEYIAFESSDVLEERPEQFALSLGPDPRVSSGPVDIGAFERYRVSNSDSVLVYAPPKAR